MTLHAIEIILTRTVGGNELRAAEKTSGMGLARSSDRKSLAVLVNAKSERKAMRKIWKKLEYALPIDVLCSLFSGPDGKRLMSIPLPPEAADRLRISAAAVHQSPEIYLEEAIMQALARDRSSRKSHLECRLNSLMGEFTPEEVVGAAARRIV